jgi:hypothetical protein
LRINERLSAVMMFAPSLGPANHRRSEAAHPSVLLGTLSQRPPPGEP